MSNPGQEVLRAGFRIHLYGRGQQEPILGTLFLQEVPEFGQQFAEAFVAAMQCHLSGNAELRYVPTASVSSRKSR